MLTLSRRVGERLYIGEGICVLVTRMGRGQVRLAIDAPRHLAIYREEVMPADFRPRRNARKRGTTGDGGNAGSE